MTPRNTVGAVTLALLLQVTLTGAALGHSLEITSPASGAIIHPGQTISITVSGTAPASTMWVFASTPLPDVSATTTSGVFSLTIPSGTTPGPYTLTAMAAENGANIQSSPVTIDVERANPPSSIEVQPSYLQFTQVGATQPLRVVGLFQDGARVDVAQSSYVTYSVANPQVATVDSHGIVQAINPGGTRLTVSYGSGISTSIAVRVPLGDATPTYSVVATPTVPIFVANNGDYGCFVNVINRSNVTLQSLTITSATLGTTPALSLPSAIRGLGPGVNQTVPLTFPASAGNPGARTLLQIQGTYVASLPGATFSSPGAVHFTFRMTLP